MPQSEAQFFSAFKSVVGERVKAKCLGQRVRKKEVFLDSDFKKYALPQPVASAIAIMLECFTSTESPPSRSITHYIDGMVVGDPELGTRIIEFDEEQHFNTFRAVGVECLSEAATYPWGADYIGWCRDEDVFNAMLRKHRLRVQVEAVPIDVTGFLELVHANVTTNNGYVARKRGFEFVGGRIAQRAYYDGLRDIAHLATQNEHLTSPLRFSRHEFEMKSGIQFSRISRRALETMIEERLGVLLAT